MILDDIAAKTRIRIEALKKTKPLEEIRDRALAKAGGTASRTRAGVLGAPALPFEAALSKPGLSFICEVKRASPSRGMIAGDFSCLDIARDYAEAGADALSVLTEPDFFLGSDAYLKEISGALTLPALRKDFTLDPYQIYEAKLLGARAVLLICALLDPETLVLFMELAEHLALSALVEAHTEQEVKTALDAGARIIGINNRDLKTFTVDLSATERLRPLIPRGVITVSESGIKGRADTERLEAWGVDAVLAGEVLMRSADKKAALAGLRGIP
jgi:indole-3-glycerol phosphate synthase